MTGRRHSAEEVDAAVAALAAGGERFAAAQEIVTHAAPGLQRILAESLHAGGFFSEAHEAEIARAAAVADPAERQAAVHTLIAEESRLGMLIGVAVGIELARELDASSTEPSRSQSEGGAA
ncbi:unannotated protein [freshwater metagenome]|uniref:Unannotated protein n=1 Tax=freshwater metagenome TaxID=449393 RepID=A0A6J7DG46_9ZZZZ|nr:hypothetical protein [Actinomycetota bacterium]